MSGAPGLGAPRDTHTPASSLPTLADMRVNRPPPRTPRDPAFDESATVSAAQAGDQTAFAALVDRYGPAVLSLCYASTLDRGEAEDLSQDIFVSAWRGLARFRGQSAFSTWLFALARNACVDRARRAAARPRLAGATESERSPGRAEDDHARRTARALLAAAGGLSAPLRQALLLRDVQGLSYDEIAELQDVPVGTVRSRLAAARATVAEEVGGR